MRDSLRIGYYNVTGLTSLKLHTITTTILPSFDLLFLAETWFMQHHHPPHPLHVASSNQPPAPVNGRYHGGITLLASPTILRQITNISTTRHSITTTIHTQTITAVYLPPSLPDSDTHELLSSLQHCDILLGDVNIRYGQAFDDSTSTNPSRRLLIGDFCNDMSLCHLRPDSGQTRNDHVFAKLGVVDRWHYVQEDTVESPHHQLMNITLKSNTPQDLPPSADTFRLRFNLKYLSDPLVVLLLQQAYNTTNHTTRDLWSKLNEIEGLGANGLERRQAMIDEMDAKIVKNIQFACSTTLGTYEPNEVQQRPDNLPKYAKSCPATPALAIRLFKRCQRSATQKLRIQSRDAALTPMADAIKFFKSTFTSIPGPTHSTFISPPLSSFNFSIDSTTSIIRSYSQVKACGEDGIHVLIMRALCDSSFIHDLTYFFKACGRWCVTPRRWNEALVFPLAKSKDSLFINEFRPVSITVMFRRLFEIDVLRQVLDATNPHSAFLLNFAQAGFVSGQACQHHVVAAHEHQLLFNNHQIFIDLKSAYDRVDLSMLSGKLADRGTPPEFILLFESLFFNCKLRLVVNGMSSCPLTMNTGLLQGSILSPLLWNIYMDDLMEKLNEGPASPWPRALAFADDIRLQTCSDDGAGLQVAVATIGRWCTANNMIVGMAKCGVVVNTTKPDSALIEFKLNDSPIPKVNQYKYLGVEFGSNGIAWDTFVQRMTKKVYGLLKFSSQFSDRWSPIIRISISKTFMLPSYEYCAPLVFAYLMTKDTLKPKTKNISKATTARTRVQSMLDSIHLDIVRWVYTTNKPTKTMFSLAALEPVEARFSHLLASFCHQTTQLPSTSVLRHVLDTLVVPPYSSLLPQLRHNKTLANYEKHCNAEDVRPKFKDYIRKQKLVRLTTMYGKLASYCTVGGRTNSGTDRALLIKDRDVAQLAKKFRTNRLHYNRKCHQGHGFTRKCFAHALSSTTFPPTITAALQKTRQDLKFDTHYTILDECLNKCKYALFFDTINEISTTSEPKFIKYQRFRPTPTLPHPPPSIQQPPNPPIPPAITSLSF